MAELATEGLSADYAPVGTDIIGTSGVYRVEDPSVLLTLTANTTNGQRQSFILIEPGEALSFAGLLTKLAFRALRDARKAKRNGSGS